MKTRNYLSPMKLIIDGLSVVLGFRGPQRIMIKAVGTSNCYQNQSNWTCDLQVFQLFFYHEGVTQKKM